MTNILKIDLIVSLFITYVCFLLLKKLRIFQYKTNVEIHKNFVSKSEGINFLLGFVLVSNYIFILKIINVEAICILIIFIIGLASDLKVLNSPRFRLLLQIILVLVFVKITNLTLTDLRINWLNQFLSNNYLAILFTAFCITILLNGVNFIDGLNCNVLFYFFGVAASLLLVANNANLGDLTYKYYVLILIIFLLILLNFKGKNYLGDNGSYSLAFIVGVLIINTYNETPNISPYYFACLLWYPAYENLFSIVRKKYYKKKPYEPDIEHFHQLFFLYIRRKFNQSEHSNTLTSVIINMFNFLVFFIAYKNNSETQFLIFLILACVVLKTFFYFFFKKLRT